MIKTILNKMTKKPVGTELMTPSRLSVLIATGANDVGNRNEVEYDLLPNTQKQK